MEMKIDNLAKVDCTGCGACYNVCPVNCIEMKADEKGFAYPVIDYDKCIHCGKCDRTCPSIVMPEALGTNLIPQTWAAWSLDENIRFESTSGGIFSELAMEVLDNGGVVCGARYNEYHTVEHCIITDKSELSIIRQSKYMESDTKKVYGEIKKYLLSGKYVLFCGAPCECAGLLSVLGKKYDNLLCVDFICRGTNSPKVFKLFLKKLEKEYDAKVKRVWFKHKKLGWRKFSTRIEFENGAVYSQDRFSDTYIRGYIEGNLYMRDCCEACKYKTMPRVSDITLGDFWGIQSKEVGAETDYGTSLVMLNSLKGEQFFEVIKNRIFAKEQSFELACAGNKCIFESPVFNKDSNIFWDNIDSMDIVENILRFCKKRN